MLAKKIIAEMKLTSDIKSAWLIHTKAVLFLLIGLMSAVLILTQLPTIKTAVLLCAAIWAFCRFYYYLFYVLERYLGREKKFAGVFDALRYLLTNGSAKN